jgi:alpha-beta hydrolase superfamily lysophospholipase
MSVWARDILGDEFQQLTLPLGQDDEGDVVATLVRALPAEQTLKERMLRRKPMLADVDVLYVHGWSDYFFNRRLARFWTSRGARFFALDLRKYGRSLRAGQTPGYISDLATYDEEIAAALAEMGHSPANSRAAGGRRLVLFGHSTGGLTLTLWAARHPDAADALILNSPWLELQLPRGAREAIMPLLKLSAKLTSHTTVPQIDFGFYSRAQQEVADDTDLMDVNLDWRPEQSTPVTPGWLNAVVGGHAQVAAGLDIQIPIYLMLSKRFSAPTRWSDELTEVDSVLVVDDIARAALKIGRTVTIERLEGALHDVFLSRREVRNDAYARMDRWVRGWDATSRPKPASGS